MFKTTSTTTTYFYDEEGKLIDKMVTRSFHTGEDEDLEDEKEQQAPCCHGNEDNDNEDHPFDELLDVRVEPEIGLEVEHDCGLADVLRFVSGCVWAANLVMALLALKRMKGRV